MKTTELHGMSDEELTLSLRDTEKHLFNLRFQSATDRLETPSEIQKARRTIARIKTVQRSRELEKLAALPKADLKKMLADLETKTTGPGKRRVKRAVQRVTHLHESKGSGQ